MTPECESGFWAGGSRSYLDQIREEEAEKTAEMREALSRETDRERRDAIKAEIKAVRAQFRERIKDARGSLFGHS